MAEGQTLELAWYGQSMFRISGGGITVVCDPTAPETGYRYEPVTADVVLVSHDHFDHSHLAGVQGEPTVLKAGGTSVINGLEVTGIDSHHDSSGGQERGSNIIFTWEQAGFRLAHFGDLGAKPPGDVLSSLAGLDIAMVPVGGVFTIDGDGAADLVRDLSPSIVFPMHYKTPDCVIPINPLEEFTDNFTGTVKRIDERPLLVTRDSVPETTEVWVVTYQ